MSDPDKEATPAQPFNPLDELARLIGQRTTLTGDAEEEQDALPTDSDRARIFDDPSAWGPME